MTIAVHAAPAITKLDARQQPTQWVIRRVLNQVGDLLLARTPLPKGAPPISEKQRAKTFEDLFQVVQSDPSARPMDVPVLDKEGMRRTLDGVEKLVTIWPDPFISPHPRNPLREIELQTRSHATPTPGLCAVDMVVVKFDPKGNAIGPQTLVWADEVYVDHWFHFLRPPTAPAMDNASTDARHADDLECAKLDHDKDDFFSARDEGQATRGVWTANAVIEQLRSSPIPFDFRCESDAKSTTAKCAETLLKAGPVRSPWVYDCGPGAQVCSLSIGYFRLDITTDGASPTSITRVAASETVVIADAPAD